LEPLEALLTHVTAIGDLAAIVVRERAFSVGICRAGAVLVSSTDTRYVQSRTAAGGWSQQRYARRRGNQRRDSYRAAADAAHRVFAAHAGPFAGLIVAGDRAAIDAVLDDARLSAVAALPRRVFPDVGEPRRAVLDDVAARALTVEITIRDADATSGT
jgi:peptide subunit release factor 1 (eRF1)